MLCVLVPETKPYFGGMRRQLPRARRCACQQPSANLGWLWLRYHIFRKLSTKTSRGCHRQHLLIKICNRPKSCIFFRDDSRRYVQGILHRARGGDRWQPRKIRNHSSRREKPNVIFHGSHKDGIRPSMFHSK